MPLQSCLSDIGAAAARFKDVVEFGFTQLTSSLIKPRVKPQIDVFLSTSHNLSEVRHGFTHVDVQDIYVISILYADVRKIMTTGKCIFFHVT